MWTLPGRLRRALAAPFRLLKGRDLALHAAAVTFYGGIAVVPVALLAVWITGLIVGAQRVRDLTGHTIAALPTAIGAPRALAALIDAGLHLTPGLALASLLPATLYGEGLRRAFLSLREGDESLVGWRGRLLWLPLLAAAPALLLALFMALPVTSTLWTRGGWYSVLGVVLSFFAAWLALTPALIWVYRYIAPGRPEWLATVLVGSFTAVPVAVILATLGVVLAALYILLMYQKVFTGPTPESMADTTELTVRERIATWPLIVAMLVLGVVPGIALQYLVAPSAAIIAHIQGVGA